eukprot:1916947-Rhodomonas_salina.1
MFDNIPKGLTSILDMLPPFASGHETIGPYMMDEQGGREVGGRGRVAVLVCLSVSVSVSVPVCLCPTLTLSLPYRVDVS